jgi:hypothetical protein
VHAYAILPQTSLEEGKRRDKREEFEGKMEERKEKGEKEGGNGKVEGKVSPMLAHPSEKFWRCHWSKITQTYIAMHYSINFAWFSRIYGADGYIFSDHAVTR